MVLGRSVQGRAITAVHFDAPHARVRVVLVGCIHGDEPAGIAITRAVDGMTPASDMDLWVIDDLNPDGVAAGTRQNARGVDLNRNFPLAWHATGHRGDPEFPGAAPLSEPETRAAFDLLNRLQPTVTIWYHQHQNLVDESGGDVAIERRYADLVGLSLRRLTRYAGSATGWQNATMSRRTTAFVVELPAGQLSSASAARYARAVLQLL